MNNVISFVRTIRRPVDEIYGLWTSPTATIEPVVNIEIDPVPGGTIGLLTSDGSRMKGVFVDVQPNRRLRYSWRWNDSHEETLVDVRFHDLGNLCLVEVLHIGFLEAASADTHLQGWRHYVDELAAL